jgi:hypothetical protein
MMIVFMASLAGISAVHRASRAPFACAYGKCRLRIGDDVVHVGWSQANARRHRDAASSDRRQDRNNVLQPVVEHDRDASAGAKAGSDQLGGRALDECIEFSIANP